MKINILSRILWIVIGLLCITAIVVLVTGGGEAVIIGRRTTLYRINGPLALMFVLLIIDASVGGRGNELFRSIASKASRHRRPVLAIVSCSIIALGIIHFNVSDKNTIWYLDSETAVANYFSAFLFFFTGIITYPILLDSRKPFLWAPLLVLFWGLAVDELIGLHNGIPRHIEAVFPQLGLERWGSGAWVAVLSPIAVFYLIWLAYFFRKALYNRLNRAKALAGITAWILTLVFEFLQTKFPVHSIQCGLEELLEFVGAVLFLDILLGYSLAERNRIDRSKADLETE